MAGPGHAAQDVGSCDLYWAGTQPLRASLPYLHKKIQTMVSVCPCGFSGVHASVYTALRTQTATAGNSWHLTQRGDTGALESGRGLRGLSQL